MSNKPKINKPNTDRAIKAVREFNKITPILSSFASAIAGKRLNVVAHTSTETDGRTIYIRPPMELADRPSHVPNLCTQRSNKTGILTCPACARTESVYYRLQHEMAHCIYESLEVMDIDWYQFHENAKNICHKYGQDEFYTKISGKLNKRFTPKTELSPVAVANTLDAHVGAMTNFMDDYRIEYLSGIRRNGFTTMSYYQARDILINGIEDDYGVTHFWKDQPDHDTLMCAWLFMAQDHDIDGHFDPAIVKAVKQFNEVYDKKSLTGPMTAVTGAIEFIAFMKTLGYYMESSDEEQGQSGKPGQGNGESDNGSDPMDSKNENSGNSESPSQDEGGSSKLHPGNDEHDNSDGSTDSTNDHNPGKNGSKPSPHADNSDDNNGSGDFKNDSSNSGSTNKSEDRGNDQQTTTSTEESTTKESGVEVKKELGKRCALHDENHNNYHRKDDNDISDEVLSVVINQSENFDDFSLEVGKLEVYRKTDEWRKRSDKKEKPNELLLGASVLHARRIFSDSKLDKNYHGMRKGKLDAKVLGSRAWGDDDRIFKRKIRAQGINSEVCIGLDISASTASNGANSKIIKMGYSVAELLSRCDVDFSIHAHRTIYSYDDISRFNQAIFTIKDTNEQWDSVSKDLCLSLVPSGGSLDGHNFEFYRKKLQRSRANRKLLIYFTDGEIPATLPATETPIMQKEFKMLNRLGIAMLGVGVYTDSPKQMGMDTVLITDHTDMRTVLREVEKRIVNV